MTCRRRATARISRTHEKPRGSLKAELLNPLNQSTETDVQYSQIPTVPGEWPGFRSENQMEANACRENKDLKNSLATKATQHDTMNAMIGAPQCRDE